MPYICTYAFYDHRDSCPREKAFVVQNAKNHSIKVALRSITKKSTKGKPFQNK